MHNIALLRKLSPAQLDVVMDVDPLTKMIHIRLPEILERLERAECPDEIVNELLFSWAQQLHDSRRAAYVAVNYFQAYDARAGTNHAKQLCIKNGRVRFLTDFENITKDEYRRAAWNALQGSKNRAAVRSSCDEALDGFFLAEDAPGVERVLKALIHTSHYDKMRRCLTFLGRDFSAREVAVITRRVAKWLTEHPPSGRLDDESTTWFAQNGSDQQKRRAFNAAVVSEWFSIEKLEAYSALLGLELTNRHLQKRLAEFVKRQDEHFKFWIVLETLEELHKRTGRYVKRLNEARRTARWHAIYECQFDKADELAALLDEPLTVEEVGQIIRWYKGDNRYRKPVKKAEKRFRELVSGKKAKSKSKPTQQRIPAPQ